MWTRRDTYIAACLAGALIILTSTETQARSLKQADSDVVTATPESTSDPGSLDAVDSTPTTTPKSATSTTIATMTPVPAPIGTVPQQSLEIINLDGTGTPTSTPVSLDIPTTTPVTPGLDAQGCNLSLSQRWCAISRECVQDWDVGCDFQCPSKGYSVSKEADASSVDNAANAVLADLELDEGPFAIAFSCIQELEGALAGSLFYILLDVPGGERITSTLYKADGGEEYQIFETSREK